MDYQSQKGMNRVTFSPQSCKVECIAVLLPSDIPFDLAAFEKSERRQECHQQASQVTPWSQGAISFDELSQKNPTVSSQTDSMIGGKQHSFPRSAVFLRGSPHCSCLTSQWHTWRRLSWPLVASIAAAENQISSQSCLAFALLMFVACFYVGQVWTPMTTPHHPAFQFIW